MRNDDNEIVNKIIGYCNDIESLMRRLGTIGSMQKTQIMK